MTETTVRCAFPQCRAKTTRDLNAREFAEYQEALRAGVERRSWDKYWAMLRRLAVRCWQHEGL